MKRCMLFLLAVSAQLQAQEYSIKLLTGQELQSILPFMAQQRIAAFREYPYLYEGNQQEENEYCQWFAKLPHSAVVVAFLNSQPVGYISGTGFDDFDTHFKGSSALLKSNGLDSTKVYYIPEAIIVPMHRNKSLITKIHALLEQHAKARGYNAICCAEESHDSHPLKPTHYLSLGGMFIKGGYAKTDMIITFPWLTIQPDGTKKNEEHALRYWVKNF